MYGLALLVRIYVLWRLKQLMYFSLYSFLFKVFFMLFPAISLRDSYWKYVGVEISLLWIILILFC